MVVMVRFKQLMCLRDEVVIAYMYEGTQNKYLCSPRKLPKYFREKKNRAFKNVVSNYSPAYTTAYFTFFFASTLPFFFFVGSFIASLNHSTRSLNTASHPVY